MVVSASEKPVSRGGSNNAVFCKAMQREGFDKLTPFMFQKEIFYAGNQVDEAKWYKHYNNSETAMNWIIDMMEERQIIGPADGSRPRQVLISEADLQNMKESTEDLER